MFWTSPPPSPVSGGGVPYILLKSKLWLDLCALNTPPSVGGGSFDQSVLITPPTGGQADRWTLSGGVKQWVLKDIVPITGVWRGRPNSPMHAAAAQSSGPWLHADPVLKEAMIDACFPPPPHFLRPCTADTLYRHFIYLCHCWTGKHTIIVKPGRALRHTDAVVNPAGICDLIEDAAFVLSRCFIHWNSHFSLFFRSIVAKIRHPAPMVRHSIQDILWRYIQTTVQPKGQQGAEYKHLICSRVANVHVNFFHVLP